MCEYPTVAEVEDWAELGERVREARLAHGLTQASFASQVGLERTALVRIEAGQRQVSALELMRIAELLELPVAHFVSRPPTAVTSRRQSLAEDADAISRQRFLLDADLETFARDTGWLVDRELLIPPPPPSTPSVDDESGARALAHQVRKTAGLKSDPIPSMAELAEKLGLYIRVVDRDADGASLLLDGYGVAVVGGQAPPGRRRFTAAHELGHHLLQDAYHSDVGVAASLDEREKLIDAFAAELLLPGDAVRRRWAESPDESPRTKLIFLSGVYRVSWSVTVATASHLGLIDTAERQRLRPATPVRGDFLAVLGREPGTDLEIGETGPGWRKAVLAAWKQGRLTAARVGELLRERLTREDLPPRETEPLAP